MTWTRPKKVVDKDNPNQVNYIMPQMPQKNRSKVYLKKARNQTPAPEFTDSKMNATKFSKKMTSPDMMSASSLPHSVSKSTMMSVVLKTLYP